MKKNMAPERLDNKMPSRDDLMLPVLNALKLLGGSGFVKEIDAKVIEIENYGEKVLKKIHKNGWQTVIKYELAWARTNLKDKFGLIKNPSRGFWEIVDIKLDIDSIDFITTKKKRRPKIKRTPVITEEANINYLVSHNFEEESNLTTEIFEKYLKLINAKNQLIFQGAPGTGKSYLANIFARQLTEKNPKQIEIIQFHSSYSYEDFVQGYRPNKKGGFNLKNGIFVALCERAKQNRDKKFAIIIDEINRGNLSKIFGELMLLLEYRDKEIRLTYSPDTKFSIPENIFVIGTMNTADRSLAMVDYALRRRFSFVTLRTDYDIIAKLLKENQCNLPIDKLIANIKNLNKQIVDNLSLGKGFEIGHSFFIKTKKLNLEKLENLWEYDLQPLLEEYFFDDILEVDNMRAILFKDLR
jgi:5-methylcytosine-specific restriction endonuclease McrBC GTP-binding regulatory subunit McrB